MNSWWTADEQIQTFFFSGDGFFTSSCGADESSFRFLDGCSVALPFRFSLSFRLFSFPCSDSSSSFESDPPFSSGSSDLYEAKKKIFLIHLLSRWLIRQHAHGHWLLTLQKINRWQPNVSCKKLLEVATSYLLLPLYGLHSFRSEFKRKTSPSVA